MKWTFERTTEGRYDIKDEAGRVRFTSSLPDRGESDQVVADCTETVVLAVNYWLLTLGGVDVSTPPKGE